MQYLTFHVGDREFAVDLARVREIVNPPPITRVPGMPPALLGLVGLRGDPTAVVDAGLRLAGRRTVPGARTPLIVLTTWRDDRASEVALLVEAAGRRLEVEALLPWDAALARIAGADACVGFADVEGRLVIVLDVDRLLAFQRVAAASALALPAAQPSAPAKPRSAVPAEAAALASITTDTTSSRAPEAFPGDFGGRAATANAEASTAARATRAEPPAGGTRSSTAAPYAVATHSASSPPSVSVTPAAAGEPSTAALRSAERSLRAPAPISSPRTLTAQAAGSVRTAPTLLPTGGRPAPPIPAAPTAASPGAERPPVGPFAFPARPASPVSGLGERGRPPRPGPLRETGAPRERRRLGLPIGMMGGFALLAAFLLAFLRTDGTPGKSARAQGTPPPPSGLREVAPPHPSPPPAAEPVPPLAPQAAQEPASVPTPTEAPASPSTPGASSAEAAPAPAAAPARRPLPPSMVVTPETPPCEIHVVRRGDTLWDISAERLGSPYRWPRLFGENRGHILDPDVIEIDDRIRIPGACNPPGGE